uniref:Apple domain-containing protein n=1 Tax=viral metagenome TaxID=1070528 RepID=A0A6C0HHC2_9ZZZZ
MSTSPVYATSKFIPSISNKELNEPPTLNAAIQVISNDNYNNVFSQVNLTGTNTAQVIAAEQDFVKTYKMGAFEVLPSTTVPAKNAHIGCKTAPEYATSNNVNMSRVDGAYHTFNTCSNKAAMLDQKYFAIVKPLPESGVKDPNLYECHVGNDPLMSKANSSTDNNYYDYITCWSIGPTVNNFSIDSTTGDIIITADNITNLGIKQTKYSDSPTTYKYGNDGTYLPVNTAVSIQAYVFDINQVTVTGGFMNGGWIGRDIPISNIALLSGTTDTFIVGVNDNSYVKMIKLQLSINYGSLYVKALEAKYSGLHRYVRITAPCNGDSWLQISELQVFDQNGVNVAKGKKVTSKDYWGGYVNSGNAVSGNATIKPYWAGHHSGTPCNSWWMIDLGQDVDIRKIVYYNRQDCCQNRIAGALLDCIGVNGAVLYRTAMTGDMVQTFVPTPQNTGDLNTLWSKAIPANLVANGTDLGYGIKGLTVRIDPKALGRGQTGYTGQSDVKIPDGQIGYRTISDIDPSQCLSECDKDSNCLGYTTAGTKTFTIEGEPTDLGCYIDKGNRAMPNRYPNGNRDTCIAAVKAKGASSNPSSLGDLYIGLQYGGECWGTSDPAEFSKYGKDNKQPCYPMGGVWQNHVYQRNITNKTVTTCNLYGQNISIAPQSSPGSGTNIAVRSVTSAPVNNTTLNLTNNAVKIDLTQCASNTCKFRLELGTDGNIKLFKQASSNGTVSSSSTGEVVWDLFSSDNTVPAKMKTFAPITNLNWKNDFNNGTLNILSPGESIPTTKKYLISPNGQFKLEIAGGYLQLKASVYGCFSTDQTYANIDAPMYTNAVSNGPQPLYVYQSDLSHPGIGKMYYGVTSPKGVAIKQINKTDPLVLGGNTYQKLSDKYMPFNDVDPNSIAVTSPQDCMTACASDKNCKYMYIKNNNLCMKGNKPLPAYIPLPSDSVDTYDMYSKSLLLDVANVSSTANLNPNINKVSTTNYRSAPIKFVGNNITGPSDIGGLATPPGNEINNKRSDLQGTNKKPNSNITTPAPGPAAPIGIYGTRPNVGINADNTKGLGSIIAGSFEGFDNHGWQDPGADCGSEGKPKCYPGILYGQIKPLQSIAQDYSNELNKINTNYLDISNNIAKYNSLYTTLNNDAKYDFAGNQQFEINGRTDLMTEMKNDSKQLALQTNNMYIAGSILTTTLLVSAIYLGRS